MLMFPFCFDRNLPHSPVEAKGKTSGLHSVAGRPEGAAWTASNDAADIAAMVARLTSLEPRLIVLEATGGCERAVVAALAVGGLPAVVANPRQVRDFA
jgi:transposase